MTILKIFCKSFVYTNQCPKFIHDTDSNNDMKQQEYFELHNRYIKNQISLFNENLDLHEIYTNQSKNNVY